MLTYILLLTPDLNVVQMTTIVIVVIVVNITCRQLRTAKAEKIEPGQFLTFYVKHVVLRTKKVNSLISK